MELNRNDIVKKINLFSLENNRDELISLLCDILEEKNWKDYTDLILIIINIGELYGYQEFFRETEELIDVEIISNQLRKELYKSQRENAMYFNSGQLSLLDEINQNNRLFISAPTSFGKTSLILEHIVSNSNSYNLIVFLAPTNALVEELYTKFLTINADCNLNFQIVTSPRKEKDKTIWILTPEKFLLLIEENNFNFDLIIMDEAYKIENTETFDRQDILNSRSCKYRKVMEFMANSSSKIVFLSPYTYIKEDSMLRFLKKYKIKIIDCNINYVKKNIIDISNNKNYKFNFPISKEKLYKGDSGILKTKKVLPYLENNTIIYVRYPSIALEILSSLPTLNLLELYENQRFKKFYHHLIDNYLFEDSEWYVIEALKKGVGIYVSPMPRYIKKEIIYLFNKGILKYLIVTTAFAEGVNSSAKNIIITSRTTGSNKKMSKLDILNLSGRAGRFGVYSIGNVYSPDEEMTEILEGASSKGVSIENPNYEIVDNSVCRNSYEIDMIDDFLLNDQEKNKKNEIQLSQEELGLTDSDLNIALSISKEMKIKLYSYFYNRLLDKDFNIECFEKIKNLLSNERKNVVESITFIFNELKKAEIPIVSDFGDINPYNRKGDFVWGIFYGIHSSGSIKEVLRSRKKYILNELSSIISSTNADIVNMNQKQLEAFLSMYDKKWMAAYISNGLIDDSKLYNGAFKFISNIIEYRIPFYIGFYISVFKLFCKKNNLEYNFDFDIIEISESLENKNIEKKYKNMVEFGIPLDTIKKINNIDNILDYPSILDEYEQIMIKEYLKYFE